MPHGSSSFRRPIHDSFPGVALHTGFVAGGEYKWPDLITALVFLLLYRGCPLHIHCHADKGVQPLIRCRVEDFFEAAQHASLQFQLTDRLILH